MRELHDIVKAVREVEYESQTGQSTGIVLKRSSWEIVCSALQAYDKRKQELHTEEKNKPIQASCGHQVNDTDDLTEVEYECMECDAVDGFYKCLIKALWCKPCAACLAKEVNDGRTD